ncbi:MAG: hypothetical protein C5B50_12845 [Verrucomicrobia bacterium]|nr:MAG: hypothetical protein C5B50_12845 [Verrucomicrobiota bacterium]
MSPFLADAINIPFVLVAGLVLLVPLLAFEVFVEALVLKQIWRMPYGKLCGFTLLANLCSLLAGIPAQILNSFVDAKILPNDIPGYFTKYATAATVGSLIYFVVTVAVEGVCALVFRRGGRLTVSSGQLWYGILLANVATYIVLAPLHYYGTRPPCQIREFAKDTTWTRNPKTKMLFTSSDEHFLQAMDLGGSRPETLVPLPMADYLISTNLALCLFRGTNGNLYFYKRGTKKAELIWETRERFFMDQAAFSPSGDRVAYASNDADSLEVVNLISGQRLHLPLVNKFGFDGPSVAWSYEEQKFFVAGFNNFLRLAITLPLKGDPEISALSTNDSPSCMACFGRTGRSRYWSTDWGTVFNKDTCADLTVQSWPGLDSSLAIYRKDRSAFNPDLHISVRPGLLHLANFYFGDVALLGACEECLFSANGYIYLLDLEQRRLGTVVKGDRFVVLNQRYLKQL